VKGIGGEVERIGIEAYNSESVRTSGAWIETVSALASERVFTGSDEDWTLVDLPDPTARGSLTQGSDSPKSSRPRWLRSPAQPVTSTP